MLNCLDHLELIVSLVCSLRESIFNVSFYNLGTIMFIPNIFYNVKLCETLAILRFAFNNSIFLWLYKTVFICLAIFKVIGLLTCIYRTHCFIITFIRKPKVRNVSYICHYKIVLSVTAIG